MKNIFVVLSNPNTFVAKQIKKVAAFHYAHASISFYEDLHEMYSFARIYKHSPVPGGPVKETVGRYLPIGHDHCDVKIFTIAVSDEQFEAIKQKVEAVFNDKEYVYNLVSAFFMKFDKGLDVYKSYTCSEFVANMLKDVVEQCNNKRPCETTPDDLERALDGFPYFEGDLVDYLDRDYDRSVEYKKTNLKACCHFLIFFAIIFSRTLFKRNK